MKNKLNSIYPAVLIRLATAVVVAQHGADPAVAVQQQDGSAISLIRLLAHVPDPELNRADRMQVKADAQRADDVATVKNLTIELEQSGTIRRTNQIELTLEDVIRRTLANNYTIDVVSYNPAVETTRLIEAQAAFDATFFAHVNKDKDDQRTDVQLSASDREFVTMGTGITKLLATGAQITGRYTLTRIKQTLSFQVLNPAYRSRFTLEITQPVLRNAGIDFNRSVIMLRRNDRRISDLAFRRQVRDTLRDVEELYWRLVQARRGVVITARELGDFEGIYEYLVARREFDITPVQIAATKADLELARADFVQRRSDVFDAEDRLVAAMNDPLLNLADDIELVPLDFPVLERIVVDSVAEAQAALNHRAEIKEQQLAVKNAKIAVGQAKNAELPRLDATLRATAHGLGANADQSFDEVTGSNFIQYFLGLEFDVPIGNRAPRAVRRRAELQYAQAVAQLKSKFEEVILDVNLAVRQLETAYDQIGPTFESVEARERQVKSIVARAERKDHNTLINELGARQRLAGTRRSILSAIIEYNIAIINLERAKGTLLEYNNIVIPTESD